MAGKKPKYDPNAPVLIAIQQGLQNIINPAGASALAASQGAWYPKAPSAVTVDTSNPRGIGLASDPNSMDYNMGFTKASLAGGLDRPESQGWLFSVVAAGRGHGSTPQGVYEKYITESASQNVAYGVHVTPQQLAFQDATKNGWIKDGVVKIDVAKALSPKGAKGPYMGTTTQTSTSTDTALTNPDSAHTLASQALSAHLGRTATPEDVAAFTAILQGREKANPVVTQQTDSSHPVGGNIHSTAQSSNRMQSGGTDPAQLADQYAQSQEGSAEYTASTQFLNAFINNLKDPVA